MDRQAWSDLPRCHNTILGGRCNFAIYCTEMGRNSTRLSTQQGRSVTRGSCSRHCSGRSHGGPLSFTAKIGQCDPTRYCYGYCGDDHDRGARPLGRDRVTYADRRTGWIFRGADECSSAASRSHTDGRWSFYCSTEFQRKSKHTYNAGPLCFTG